jgi:hypothetical protein
MIASTSSRAAFALEQHRIGSPDDPQPVTDHRSGARARGRARVERTEAIKVVDERSCERIRCACDPVGAADLRRRLRRHAPSSEIRREERVVASAGLRFPEGERLEPRGDVLERRPDPGSVPVEKYWGRLPADEPESDVSRMQVPVDHRRGERTSSERTSDQRKRSDETPDGSCARRVDTEHRIRPVRFDVFQGFAGSRSELAFVIPHRQRIR